MEVEAGLREKADKYSVVLSVKGVSHTLLDRQTGGWMDGRTDRQTDIDR